MIITIHEGYDNTYVILTCNHSEFKKAYGSRITIHTKHIYRELSAIAKWCNNIAGEECLFEID